DSLRTRASSVAAVAWAARDTSAGSSELKSRSKVADGRKTGLENSLGIALQRTPPRAARRGVSVRGAGSASATQVAPRLDHADNRAERDPRAQQDREDPQHLRPDPDAGERRDDGGIQQDPPRQHGSYPADVDDRDRRACDREPDRPTPACRMEH